MTTAKTNNKILMIAFDFPPCQSAGVQRTLKFATYLRDFGWDPIILTVDKIAHARTDNSVEIPSHLKNQVFRSIALDASRHLSIKGRHFSWSRVPDKWWSWALTGIRKGHQLIKQFQPNLIWSTYPIPTAHYIAYRLHKKSGIPWVADFRDPVQSRYDPSAQKYSAVTRYIEKQTISNACKVIFTTQQAAELYSNLYSQISSKKFQVIQNGFDEKLFKDIQLPYQVNTKFRLLYSGAIYANGRDPSELFKALSELKSQEEVSASQFELIFQGAGDGRAYQSLIEQLNISDLVRFMPSVNYIESLKFMSNAHALLVVQGSLFSNQIPGKIYEYLRIGKPIIALTPEKSATGQLLAPFEHSYVSDKASKIAESLRMLFTAPTRIEHPLEKFSRYNRTAELASILDQEKTPNE